ncbi:SDR family NAD(P)-dependent oxidoreductase [Streptomonospora litoralis]|uniref:Short chain dehydrogenase n=1 Tax=Streptomonospora litoralis TaxID=2498135 RepID=A0A4P6Q9Y8_9ACTN|nr:SDR family NAD(P)-dependent oxidoreductase [Streptomonospora litoralis]QBI56154.1 short chain dehydrogenase [Streptomonospora litoralis]
MTALLVSGASGTLGQILLAHLEPAFPRIIAVSRSRPAGLRPSDTFISADLSTHGGIADACSAVSTPITGVVLATGIDSRRSLTDLADSDFDTCMRTNCLSQLRLLAAAATHRAAASPLPVAVISSDVVGGSTTATLVYAASKAALEDGARHAVADDEAMPLLLMRLPDIGVPMGTPRDTPRPEPAPAARDAAECATAFLTTPPPTPAVRMWHHA